VRDEHGSATDRSERGSATMLMIGLMAVVVLLSATAMLVAGYLVGQHRARAAADLSALSAAAAFQSDGDGCAQARQTARHNGAQVTRCDRVGDRVDWVVTVRVAVLTRTRVPGLPRAVTAEAHAEPTN
jgi:secretion/DNA translocation related TadE-like protein